MASTTEGRKLTEAHRRRQLSITRTTLTSLRAVWPLLDVNDLDRTFPNYFDAAYNVIRPRKRESVEVSSDYLDRFRVAEYGEGSPGWIDLERLAELSTQQAATSLLVTGPIQYRISRRAGHSPSRAQRIAEQKALGAGMRLVLEGGRNTIYDRITSDPAVRGYARVTDGDPCYFCAMLSGRAAVYTKETGSFQAHDKCGCTAELIYDPDSYNLPGKGSQFSDLWSTSTKGHSGQDAINAFRRAYQAQNK